MMIEAHIPSVTPNMAYFYRGAQSPRDEHPPPASNNPLSPQRNPNRLSGGMQMANGSARGGLPRRFTTNELPTVSPFLNHSQQRKLAAGDYLVSSQRVFCTRNMIGGSLCLETQWEYCNGTIE